MDSGYIQVQVVDDVCKKMTKKQFFYSICVEFTKTDNQAIAMAKPPRTTTTKITTTTTTTTTTTNTEDFKVNEYVLAQAASATGDWYAHYPAVIQGIIDGSNVVCKWIDPDKMWVQTLEVIPKDRLLNWNYHNINQVCDKEVPEEEKAYWKKCTRSANSRILGKICFSRRKDRDIL